MNQKIKTCKFCRAQTVVPITQRYYACHPQFDEQVPYFIGRRWIASKMPVKGTTDHPPNKRFTHDAGAFWCVGMLIFIHLFSKDLQSAPVWELYLGFLLSILTLLGLLVRCRPSQYEKRFLTWSKQTVCESCHECQER